jgi:hypothetical protein
MVDGMSCVTATNMPPSMQCLILALLPIWTVIGNLILGTLGTDNAARWVDDLPTQGALPRRKGKPMGSKNFVDYWCNRITRLTKHYTNQGTDPKAAKRQATLQVREEIAKEFGDLSEELSNWKKNGQPPFC